MFRIVYGTKKFLTVALKLSVVKECSTTVHIGTKLFSSQVTNNALY